MKKLLSFLFLLFSFIARAQTNLYVDSSVSASGAGTTWPLAFKTLNEALNAANSGSTTVRFVINIARGTYYPTGDQSATNRDSTFLIARGNIQLMGGFPAGGGARNPFSNPTVLSGDIGTAANNSDNSYHVIVGANVSSALDSIIVSGMRVTGGNANGTSSRLLNTKSIMRAYGGAVYNIAVGAKMIFTECSFNNNTALNFGGSIYNENSSAYISSCTFYSNTATGTSGAGGAIYWTNTTNSAGIIACTFSGNAATTTGGAIHCSNDAGGGFIRNSVFSGNTAATGGAIILLRSITNSNQRNSIDSCSFSGNAATGTISGNGGAIYDYTNVGIGSVITRCTFTGNMAAVTGGAVSSTLNNNPFPYYFRNCRVTGNVAGSHGGGVYYSCPGGTPSVIDSSLFSGNKSGGNGGGLYSFVQVSTLSNGTVSRCAFSVDTAALGGGGAFSSGSMMYVNCSFMANRATLGGGLLIASTGAAIIKNDTLQGNTATWSGGGLYAMNANASCSVSNCLFAGNRALSNGGAISDSTADLSIINCTLSGDTAVNGNGIHNNNSSPAIQNTIIWEGAANSFFNVVNSVPVVSYSTVQGGYSGTGNLSIDPKFTAPVAASVAPTLTGNYKLLACSPVIDKGNPSGIYTGVLDLAGNARLTGGFVDHGAYENPGGYPLSGPTSVCLGSTTLYSNVTAGGIWASSSPTIATISTAGILTAVAAGIDTITYTVAGTSVCAGITSRIVTVLPLPTVAPITSTKDSICGGGGTQAMYNMTSGGVWSSSDTTMAVISTSGVVTGRSSGVDTIYYAYTNSSGCKAIASKIITILSPPIPGALTGNTNLCKGANTQLSTSSTGGFWYSNSVTIATVNQAGIIKGIASGTATIEYRLYSAQGCIGTVSTVVTVYPALIVGPVTGSDSVCMKGTLQLFDTSTGGTWRSANTSIALVNGSGLVTPVSGGSVGIAYIVSNGAGCTDSGKKIIYVNAINTMVTQSGAKLTATQSGAAYRWLDCGNGKTPVSGANSQIFIATSLGSYAVELTKDGCTDTSNCMAVTNLAVTGAGSNPLTMELFPNPANASITVRAAKLLPNSIVILKDITGKELLRKTMMSPLLSLNLAEFSPGIYLLEVNNGTVCWTQRLTIVR